MSANLYKVYFVIIVLISCFFSCEKKQKRIEKKKEISFREPVKINASFPHLTLLDTCPKPLIINIPVKGSSDYTVQTNEGPKTVKLFPPQATPILAGEAGGFNSMQNYNTEQGLALSSVCCGYKDKTGNLWFGTTGGGVSKYDGKSFTNFTSTQGLANNLVKCIIEDKTGNLWFATSGGGVSKYDGKSFTNFTTNNGLVNNRVLSITEDKTGNLWFSTAGGISKYDPKLKKFTNFTISEGLASNDVTASITDKKGNIWFGTYNGISKYNPNVEKLNCNKCFTNYTVTQGLGDNNVMSILEDNMGNIWFGTNGGGISKYTPTLKEGAEDKLFTNFNHTQGLLNDCVTNITEDKRGYLWLATNKGISKFNPNIKEVESTSLFMNFTSTQGFNNLVFSITEDKTGNIWLGTNGAGLNKYDGNSLTSFALDQGLIGDKIWDINEGEKESIWFVGGNGISIYDRKSFTNFTLRYITPSTRSVLKDKMGRIWFGSSFGVTMYDGNTFTNYTMAQGLPHNTVLSIAEDKKGNLWFGTYGGGVSKYDGNRIDAFEKGENTSLENQKEFKKINGKFVKSFTNFTKTQGLAGNTIKCIVEDKMGNMWFATNGDGISKYDGKSFTNYLTAQGLPNNTVYSILEDKAGTLWFGTAGGGVFKYNPSTKESNGTNPFTTYTSAHGLANDVVYSIVEDTLNNMIWFGTNLGLSGLKLNSLSPESNGAIFENFNKNTGYPIKDVNTSALFLDKKGIIWAGTSDKLVRFDYSGINKSAEPPSIVIQAIKIQGEGIAWYSLKSEGLNGTDSMAIINEEIITMGHSQTEVQRDVMRKKFGDIKFDSIARFYPVPQNLVLPFVHNNITFDFVAIETARPFMINYQYILEGYDKEWSPITAEATASFGNISEGTYVFKLKTQSPDGIWSKPITYTFKVLPPWYRTWWMYLGYLAFGLLLIGMFIRWRERNLKREKVILEDKVELRTKQLEEKNKIVEEQKNIVEEKNKIVEEQKKEVEEKNIKITDSINYAKRIQQAILPSQELIKSFFPDSFIFFKPKDIVSGDFYWFTEKVIKTEHGDDRENNSELITLNSKLIIAVADCTGHGVPGAFMSMIGNTLLNEIVNVKNICEPAQILNQMNNGIVTLLRQNNNESTTQDDGMDLSIISIDKINGEIEFAGANHFSYLFNQNQLKKLDGDVFSIGGMFGKADINFSSKKVKIEKGSTFYLFTDGFVDQFGGEKNTKYLSARFEKLLQSIQQNSMEKQHELLIETFDDWKGNNKQLDDITIIGFRI